jgi:two-component system, NarL family, nitrate/nitrite response regulator NarL
MSVVIVAAREAIRRDDIRRRLVEAGVHVDAAISDADAFGSDAGPDSIVVATDPLWREIANLAPDTRVIAVTEHEGEAVAALNNGRLAAWGVVSAHATSGQLAAALGAVDAGLVALPAEFTLIADESPATDEDLDGAPFDEALTPREHEVLELLVQGQSNRRIAEALAISEHTVKFHVASIYGKLGARSRADVVRRAYRRGLVSL